MTLAQENELMRPLVKLARSGRAPKPEKVKQIVEERLGRKVSKSYIYKLLRRHGWADALRQSRPPTPPLEDSDTFDRLVKPWLRAP